MQSVNQLIRSSRSASAISTIFILGLFAAWYYWIGHPDFPLDDAYIVRHSVQGLLDGVESAFPGSSPMTGVTSPAHVLMVAAFATFAPTPYAQVIATGVALLLYVTGVYAVGRAYGLNPNWSRLLTLASIISGSVVFQTLNGLETSLAMAAVAWAIALFAAQTHTYRRYLLLSILPFIRPELAVLSALFFLQGISQQKGEASTAAFKATGYCALGAVPFVVFLLITTGTPIPNTLAAKTYFFAEGCASFTAKAYVALQALVGFCQQLGIIAAGFVAVLFTRLRWIALTFMATFIAAYILRLPGGLFHNYHRYLYPLLPICMAGLAAWAAHHSPRVAISGKAVIALGILWSAAQIPSSWATYVHDLRSMRVDQASVAAWLDAHADPNQPTLIHDAGYLSATGKRQLFDLVGLKSPMAVEVHKSTTWASCGRRPDAIATIAAASRAKYLVVAEDWDRIFLLTSSLLHQGWQVQRADPDRPSQRYQIYEIAEPSTAP